MAEQVRMRLEVTAVLEYDANPADYDGATPEEIRLIDERTAEDDLYLFLDNEDTKWTIDLSVASQQKRNGEEA